jgi:hypothetical protein
MAAITNAMPADCARNPDIKTIAPEFVVDCEFANSHLHVRWREMRALDQAG